MLKSRGIGSHDDVGPSSRKKLKRTAEATSKTGDWMMDLYRRGKLTAPELVTGARAEAKESVAASSLATRLSKGKRCAHNASRDVMRALNKRVEGLPEPYEATTWFWDRKK